MKNYLILIAGLLLPAAATSQNVPESIFELRINAPELADTIPVYLLYQQHGERFIDSAFRDHGTYVMTGTAEQPVFATLVADHQRAGIGEILRSDSGDFIQLYLHPGSFGLRMTDKLSEAVFTGSPINTDNARLQEMLKEITELRGSLSKELVSTVDRQQISLLRQQLDSLTGAEKPVLKQFVLEHPDSFIALVALQRYAGIPANPEIILPMFQQLSPAVRASVPAQEFHQFLLAGSQLAAGARAPEFTQPDTAGRPISLSSFRGSYLLLEFWASWCGPCRQKNPGLRQLYKDFKERKFTILGVSLDRESGRDAWLKAIKDDELNWTHVGDLKHWDNQVAKLYGVRQIPGNFLIDPEGIIIARDLDQQALRRKLEEILPAK